MSIHTILDQLYEERKLIDQAIVTLEHLARGRKRGPGRPPGRVANGTGVDHGVALLAASVNGRNGSALSPARG